MEAGKNGSLDEVRGVGFERMHARCRDNRAAYSGFRVLRRGWRALMDREPWLLSLPPGARVAMEGGRHTRTSAAGKG